MSIQRYHFYNIYGTPIPDNKVIDDNGDYVLYTAHAAEVERLTAERDALDQGRDQANADTEETRKEMVQWREWCVKAQSERDAAESSLAAMRQRAEELQTTADMRAAAADHWKEQAASLKSEKKDAIARAERAESCLRRVQRLADDGVDDPAGPYNVLAQIANTAEVVLSSPPADASRMGGEREKRLVCLLKEAVMNVGSLQLDRSAAKWVYDVQAVLAEMEQKS